MAIECAVCYVSDLNFLLPTLVSATGLRKFVLAHKADVYIFLIDEDDELNRFLNRLDICVMPMDSRSYTGFDVKHGDTWIQRDPSPLIEAIIPDGRFDFPLS